MHMLTWAYRRIVDFKQIFGQPSAFVLQHCNVTVDRYRLLVTYNGEG